ncbi:uncharacterized protein ACIB01_001058 [Guaruba guarouba]
MASTGCGAGKRRRWQGQGGEAEGERRGVTGAVPALSDATWGQKTPSKLGVLRGEAAARSPAARLASAHRPGAKSERFSKGRGRARRLLALDFCCVFQQIRVRSPPRSGPGLCWGQAAPSGPADAFFRLFTSWLCPANIRFHTRLCLVLPAPPKARGDVQGSPNLPLHRPRLPGLSRTPGFHPRDEFGSQDKAQRRPRLSWGLLPA